MGNMAKGSKAILEERGFNTDLKKKTCDLCKSTNKDSNRFILFDIGANMAVTIAAAHMNIPVFHIQGGEVTGSIDESIRHAMSKFSHIHLPATEDAKNRLVRMGENPNNIFVVGCPSIDVLKDTPYISKIDLEKEFDLDFSKPFIIMIQHPVTTEARSSLDQIKETIIAIKELKIQCIVLLPNNDAGFSKIIEEIKQSGLKWYPSLPTDKFINLYRNAWALVGNSSSGIHETPTFKIPAVNIGNRQSGRERAQNVIDVPNERIAIKKAIEKALYNEEFRQFVSEISNPYGEGNSAEKIIEVIKKIPLNDELIQKKFYE
jgi:UDP-N-acetylglucosamine 2-epimerase (non-hydrolysing)/GDP/UDP-N,N'-diacetylbacillosamine 2-epimerase (hydrolysing)